MKLESAFFDKIRVKKGARAPRTARAERVSRACDAEGCSARGEFRAPKGRHAEGEYFWFCLDHVRAYNKTYNYFAGMDDASIQSFQKASVTGHRPTWRVGVNAGPGQSQPPTGRTKFGRTSPADDPFHLFRDGVNPRPEEELPRRTVRNMERRSLDVLGLDERASPAAIKARYKLLVKRNHPDANGGDRSLEDRLREIIQAYNYLKGAGFC